LGSKKDFVMNKLSLTALILGSGLALAGSVLAGTGGADCHGGKGIDRMGQLDTNKDGKVSLAELVASKQSWLSKLDSNKDGVATQAELDAGMQARRTEHINELFAEQDTNKDGRISREESRLPARWFTRVDANNDGNLTPEEFTQRPARPDAAHAEGHHGKVSEMDANSDGKIDAAEVKSAAERMLKRLDKNGDGTLDATELVQQGHGGRHHGGPGRGNGAPNPTATQAS
jgi:Ca2+-binding EF-hand superfamily protein